MGRRSITALVAALLALIPLAPAALATQLLVKPGEDWSSLGSRVKEGDEIILMPGRHRAASFEKLHGTAKRPITIRGLDPARPPVIEADRYGLRLVDPRHVRVRGILVQGAKSRGILITGPAVSGPSPPAPGGPRGKGPVLLEDIAVVDTGPQGQRHAIEIEHIDNVRVRRGRFEAWAGSGIELVDASSIAVEECLFAGRTGFGQLAGVRIRAGCRDVSVTRCRFDEVGGEGVCIGGTSQPEEFGVPPAPDAKPGSLSEAMGVQVNECLFLGGDCAISLVGADRCAIRQCTIVGPRFAVVSMRVAQADPRYIVARHCTFGSNLVTWKAGSLKHLAHKDDAADEKQLILEENLWWSPDPTGEIAALPFPGVTQFPQITDMDPKLNAEYRPQFEPATMFGVP